MEKPPQVCHGLHTQVPMSTFLLAGRFSLHAQKRLRWLETFLMHSSPRRKETQQWKEESLVTGFPLHKHTHTAERERERERETHTHMHRHRAVILGAIIRGLLDSCSLRKPGHSNYGVSRQTLQSHPTCPLQLHSLGSLPVA